MRPHTDSETIEYHEDGSWTTTTVVTNLPATKTQKFLAAGALAALPVLVTVPVIAIHMVDEWFENRRREEFDMKDNF